MKRTSFSFLCLLMALFFVTSCGPNLSKASQDAEGFAQIQEEFKNKFGADAYYTDISVNYTPDDDEGSGLGFSATVTNDPASLKMREYTYSSYGGWRATADVTLEIEDDSDPKEFMYQLGVGKFDLKKVGELVEASKKKLAEEKQVENAILSFVLLKTPDNDSADESKILVMLKSEEGKSYSLRYDLDGNLENLN